ncbi:hypothetical protein PG999_001445 [Apiospora kogelbergensis]|uniref:C2H2-type domain-containing protein n=1 Tax=Apiospora kogelbergensis TaxID=1337665 RepID=A0AAW0REB2_9PEZI
MEEQLDTVSALVTALLSTYDDGLECYTRWQRKRWQTNHYQGRARGCDAADSGDACGLSTSLRVSRAQVRQAHDGAADVLGAAFSTGDNQCRGALQSSLRSLQTHVEALRGAARRHNGGPLELLELVRASEAARASSLRALAEQYQRVAVGRLVPRELPVRPSPPRRPSAASSSAAKATATAPLASELMGGDDSVAGEVDGVGYDDDCDGDSDGEKEAGSEQGDGEEDAGVVDKTASRSHGGPARPNKSPFQPQPPSPPPTPKMISDDLQSTCTSEFGPRPRASVFSVFCPEAMKYQVDLQRPMPSSSSSSSPSPLLTSQRRKKKKDCCGRCGYRWSDAGGGNGNSRDSVSSRSDHNSNIAATTMVKDGFRLTPRFLGKSHCRGGGFGCVLCTSGGKTDVYESVEGLRDHINASHDKWQMLHERDMANR